MGNLPTIKIMENNAQPTLEEYLKTNWENKVYDFRLVPYNDGTFFYIHPLNVDGETPNYRVKGNTLFSPNEADYTYGETT